MANRCFLRQGLVRVGPGVLLGKGTVRTVLIFRIDTVSSCLVPLDVSLLATYFLFVKRLFSVLL